MSWRERPYSHDDDGYGNSPAGFPRAGGSHGDGLRSWFGGLPAPQKAVRWLIMANVALFILSLATGGEQGPIFRWFALYAGDVYRGGQVWRLWTATYLHDQDSILHLLFNMIGLYFFGMPLEQVWGARRVFLFYTAGGVLANLIYLLVVLVGWLPASFLGIPISLVGASGCIFALMGACAVLFPGMRLILILFPVPIRTVCLLFLLMYGWNLAVRGANAGGDACHLAGIGFGIYWGYRGSRWFEKIERWQGARQGRRWESQRRQAHEQEQRVDQILEKVRQQGIQSLTRGEKRVLEEATRSRQSSAPRGRPH